MDIENGDVPPDILTEEEAEQVLVSGNDGDSYLTVRTTEEQTQQVAIEFRQEYKPDSDMYVGEKRVEVEGREGTKAVTKKIVRKNGQPVEEEVLDEEIIREPAGRDNPDRDKDLRWIRRRIRRLRRRGRVL